MVLVNMNSFCLAPPPAAATFPWEALMVESELTGDSFSMSTPFLLHSLMDDFDGTPRSLGYSACEIPLKPGLSRSADFFANQQPSDHVHSYPTGTSGFMDGSRKHLPIGSPSNVLGSTAPVNQVLPDLDGDDPTMGLDILSCSDSCGSMEMDQEELGPSCSSLLRLDEYSDRDAFRMPLSSLPRKSKPSKQSPRTLGTPLTQALVPPSKTLHKWTASWSKPRPAGPPEMGPREQQRPHPLPHARPTSSADSQHSLRSATSDPGQDTLALVSRNEAVSSLRMRKCASQQDFAAAIVARDRKRAALGKKAKVRMGVRGGVHKPKTHASGSTAEGHKRDKAAAIVCANCSCTNTPQWRMGPTGPKTLCNACGVRYKKGLPLKMEGGNE
mmetsp:Transcript_15042/g.28913  ORF Transcript_15042/g.28913 Transcript_15042/m.28913 type:complete len:385 (+) Transcript_15042:203-1357(+)